MKKLLLLFFSVIIISNSYSQNFVQEGKQRNVLTYAWLSELTCFNKLEGDTVIDSKLYKKVWYSCDSLMIDWSINGQ